MSRYQENDEYVQKLANLWHSNMRRALKSKRGQSVLVELREALLALPKHELIEGAMCTVNPEKREFKDGRNASWYNDELATKGEGVCAMGAYAWYKLVKSGVDPIEAFDQVPTMLDLDSDLWETAEYGRDRWKMAVTLAWEVAYQNDERLGDVTPAVRWERMLMWVNSMIVAHAGWPSRRCTRE